MPTKECKKKLQGKIKKNIEEMKKGRYKNIKQAIAVSYSQMPKKCKMKRKIIRGKGFTAKDVIKSIYDTANFINKGVDTAKYYTGLNAIDTITDIPSSVKLASYFPKLFNTFNNTVNSISKAFPASLPNLKIPNPLLGKLSITNGIINLLLGLDNSKPTTLPLVDMSDNQLMAELNKLKKLRNENLLLMDLLDNGNRIQFNNQKAQFVKNIYNKLFDNIISNNYKYIPAVLGVAGTALSSGGFDVGLSAMGEIYNLLADYGVDLYEKKKFFDDNMNVTDTVLNEKINNIVNILRERNPSSSFNTEPTNLNLTDFDLFNAKKIKNFAQRAKLWLLPSLARVENAENADVTELQHLNTVAENVFDNNSSSSSSNNNVNGNNNSSGSFPNNNSDDVAVLINESASASDDDDEKNSLLNRGFSHIRNRDDNKEEEKKDDELQIVFGRGLKKINKKNKDKIQGGGLVFTNNPWRKNNTF